MDLEAHAQQLLGHRRALDVPARATPAPGRVPRRVLPLLLGLPEREVQRVLLAIGPFDPLALVEVVELAVRERPVVGVGAHAEVDVAVDRVGGVALDQRGDQRHDPVDRLRGQRLVVGPRQAERVGVGDVVRGHLARELLRADPTGLRGVVDLVVDVGHVGDERHVVALMGQEAL